MLNNGNKQAKQKFIIIIIYIIDFIGHKLFDRSHVILFHLKLD